MSVSLSPPLPFSISLSSRGVQEQTTASDACEEEERERARQRWIQLPVPPHLALRILSVAVEIGLRLLSGFALGLGSVMLLLKAVLRRPCLFSSY
jgi:hypothetical protein